MHSMIAARAGRATLPPGLPARQPWTGVRRSYSETYGQARIAAAQAEQLLLLLARAAELARPAADDGRDQTASTL